MGIEMSDKVAIFWWTEIIEFKKGEKKGFWIDVYQEPVKF